MIVSTSSTSLLRQLIRFLKAPEATDAGYSFAKLLKPNMAARRSSRSVALCKRPLRVLMVLVAFCFAGACDSRMRNIAIYPVDDTACTPRVSERCIIQAKVEGRVQEKLAQL